MTRGLRIKRKIGIAVHGIGQAIFYSGSLCALGVLIFQLAGWLRDGHWTPLPLTQSLFWGTLFVSPTSTVVSFLTWLNHPASWFGLHYLLSMTPTVLGLALVGFAGMLTADWGRAIRRRIDEMERDQVTEWPRTRRFGDEAHPVYDAESVLRSTNRRITADVTPVERDIVRWLAMNEAVPHLTVQDVVRRNLGCPATDLEGAVATLVDRGFITLIGGRLVLLKRGRLYCIEAPWTVSASRVS